MSIPSRSVEAEDQDKALAELEQEGDLLKQFKDLRERLTCKETFLTKMRSQFPDSHPVVIMRGVEVSELKEKIKQIAESLDQVSSGDADSTKRRDLLKELIKDAKSWEEDPNESAAIKCLEEKLAELQPPQQAPAIHNQLQKNQAKAAGLLCQKEQAKLVKEQIQEAIDEKQQQLANVDRNIAQIDLEIEELGKQASVLVEQMGLTKVTGNTTQQPPSAEIPPLTSEARTQRVIAELRGAFSLEQMTMMWNSLAAEPQQQQQGTPLQQQQPPNVVQQEVGQPQDAVASASHRGPAGAAHLRRKPKEIPATSIEHKAAIGRAAVGLAREELREAARASVELESNADGEEDAIRLRLEEEMAQQSLP